MVSEAAPPKDDPVPDLDRRLAADLERGCLRVFANVAGFHVAGLVEYNFEHSEALEALFPMRGRGLAVYEESQHGE